MMKMLRLAVLATWTASLTCGYVGIAWGEQESLTIESGSALNIPLADLAGAKVVGLKGTVIKFADGSGFSIEPLLKEDLGYDLDLHRYPRYLLGIADPRETESLSKDALDDLDSTRVFIAEELGPNREIMEFKTERGWAFAGLGERRSMLFMIEASRTDVITQVSAHGMSIDAVKRILIEGAR